MSVKNTLSDRCPGIEDGSVAVQTFSLCDLVGGDKEGCSDNGGHTCKSRGIFYVDCRNYHDVSRRLRHDVSEGDDVLIAIHDGGWDFAFNNLAEQAFRI